MTDEQLLTAFLATKDREVLASLYERMHSRLYALAFSILQSQDEAEDIVEDVFCKLYDLEPESIRSAESFLFKIAQNLSLDCQLAKHRGIRKDMVSLASMKLKSSIWIAENSQKRSGEPVIEEPIDRNLEIAAQQTQKQELIQEHWEKTKTIFESLPPGQKDAIELYHGRGLTITETAECLRVSESTAWMRIRHGIATLRKELLLDGETGKRRPYPCPVQAKDVDTGTVVHEFPCIKDTVTAGYPVTSVRRALRKGKVYKGLKWSYCNAV